jgi:hypothetical protein
MSAPRPYFLCLAAAWPLLMGAPGVAQAQAYVSASSVHPVILLDAYMDYSALLLTPASRFKLSTPWPARVDTRMAAYRDFERSLSQRTAGIVGRSSSSAARSEGKDPAQAGSGKNARIEGASLLYRGQAFYQSLKEATRFDLSGYRFRVRLGEALDGRLALRIQKNLQ